MLAPRLAVYPEWARTRALVDEELRSPGHGPVRRRGPRRGTRLVLGGRGAPAATLARELAGRPADPRSAGARCDAGASRGRRGRGARCWPGVLVGQEVGEDEIVTLFRRPGPRGRGRWPRWPTSCAGEAVGDVVTFVANRNINYTNICTFKCRFCAFSKGPLSLNLRGSPYLLGARARSPGASSRPRPGGRHRGLPARRHPPRLRRRVLPRGAEGGPGGFGDASTSTPSPPSR